MRISAKTRLPQRFSTAVFSHSAPVLLSALCFSVLFLAFYNNAWKACGADLFAEAGEFEGAVIGRLIISEREGITSFGGFPGWAIPANREAFEADRRKTEYDIYYNELDFVRFKPYFSQTGGQTILFSILDRLSPLKKRENISIFKGIVASALAIILTIFLIWIFSEFGLFSALITLLTLVLSQWLTAYGRNLWFLPAAFFLPMVSAILFFHFERTERPRQGGLLGLVVFFAVLAKLVLTGFEFVSSSLLMIFVPLAYFGIARHYDARLFRTRLVRMALFATLAVVVALSVLSLQCALVSGSVRLGFDHIVRSIEKRTMSSEYDPRFSPEINKGLQSDLWSVLGFFWNRDLVNSELVSGVPIIWRFGRISYKNVILCFIVCSVISILISEIEKNRLCEKERRKDVALNVAFLVSFIPPLSWYVLFKGHAFMHKKLDTLAWHLPLMLFGAVLAARTTESVARIVRRSSSR